MLTFSFADPDPGSCAFSSVADPGCLSRIRLFSILDPDPQHWLLDSWNVTQDPEYVCSGSQILDHESTSYVT
jgi:hypothetical protein